MIYLYDPKTNLTTKTDYEKLIGITGMKKNNLQSHRSKKRLISRIGCYIVDKTLTLEQRREWYSAVKYKDEHWVTVEGSNNQFQVSQYGRVRRLYKNGNKRFMLPFQRKGEGNLHVKAYFLGKYQDHKIGHIVAHHFIGRRPKEMRVIRKNGIITDDYAANLEYVSTKELGKRTGYMSRNKPVVQLDYYTNELLGEYKSIREAGRELFISHEAIRLNVNGESDRCLDFTFMCAELYEKSKSLCV